MWLMMPYGILMPSLRPPGTVEEGDPRTLQIRARRKRDLDVLATKMGADLGPIYHTPHCDYNYRAYCTPEAFGAVIAAEIAAIDYEKFKPTTDRYAKGDSAAAREAGQLHGVYNSIWGIMTRLGAAWEGTGDWAAGGVPVNTKVTKRRYSYLDVFDSGPRVRSAGGRERRENGGWDRNPVPGRRGIGSETGTLTMEDVLGNDYDGAREPMTLEEQEIADLFDELSGIPEDAWAEYLTDEEYALVTARLKAREQEQVGNTPTPKRKRGKRKGSK